MRISFLVGIVAWVSCSTRPDPLEYGKDACYACKMILVDKRFGAEIITKKGKVYKFDDLNCMVGFYKSGAEPKDNVSTILVTDFDHENNLLRAEVTYFINASAVRSPMGGQTAAFADVGRADKFNLEWKGQRLNWNGVIQTF